MLIDFNLSTHLYSDTLKENDRNKKKKLVSLRISKNVFFSPLSLRLVQLKLNRQPSGAELHALHG